MKVYRDDGGERSLIGRAEIPDDVGVVLDVELFGAESNIKDRFVIATITHLGPEPLEIRVERAVLVAQGQFPEFLPGWQPLSS